MGLVFLRAYRKDLSGTLGPLIVALLWFPLSARASIFQGNVTDACFNVMIAGVAVILELEDVPGPITAHTDSGGFYRFSRIPRGRYTVTFRAIGYRESRRTDLELEGERTYRLNQRLQPVSRTCEDPVPYIRPRSFD